MKFQVKISGRWTDSVVLSVDDLTKGGRARLTPDGYIGIAGTFGNELLYRPADSNDQLTFAVKAVNALKNGAGHA